MKWEYHIIRFADSSHLKDAEADLNTLGQNGWEAVSAWYSDSDFGTYVLLKRPISK
jgi:hypothetical protein